MAGLLAVLLACSSHRSGGSGSPSTPALSIASPSADVTATNGVLRVEVRVEGDAQSVQLLVDGAPLVGLSAPFQYDWNTRALPEASYELRAEMVSGGKTYESAPKTVVVDRTRPEPPAIDPLVCATSATAVALVGTAEANATVTVYEGSTELAAVSASGAGSWRLDVALGAGSHALLATARDAAGNVSDALTRSVNVDGSLSPVPDPPTPTKWPPALTNFPSLRVEGLAHTGNTIYLYWDEQEATREDHKAQGHFEVTAPDGSWGTFVDAPEGTHVFTATQRTPAGCESRPTAPQTVVDDRTHPGAPQILSAVPGLVNRAGPASFPVNGTAEAKATVRVYVGATWVEAQAGDAGEWAATVQTSDLPEGSDVLKATAQDPAGNTSPEASTAAILVDRIPPTAPTIATSVSSPTNATSFILSGAITESGVAVTVYDNGAQLGTATVNGTAWRFTVSPAEGAHSYTAKATDGARNDSSASAALAIVVDRTPPVVPTIATSVSSPTNATSFILSGSTEAGATVAVYDSGVQLGTATRNGTAWRFTVSPGEGAHSYTATAADSAGNVSSASAALVIVVDRTPPGVPALAVLPASGNVGTVFRATGSAEVGSTVNVYEVVGTARSWVVAATADGSGAWSVNLPAMPVGSHTFTATATDRAGNASTESATGAITVTAQ